MFGFVYFYAILLLTRSIEIRTINKWKNKTEKKAYLKSLIESEEIKPIKYNKSLPHRLGQYISHPKFGEGFVQGKIGENKVQVFFSDAEKILLQNWI